MSVTNVVQNLDMWDRAHDWSQHGDEWTGQAKLCGVTYEDWKASLVEHLIAPNTGASKIALEIAPGHGRWTEFLLVRSKHVIGVDLSPSCLAHCRERFGTAANLDLYLTSGVSLPKLATGQIDFVWSYDSFVHMDRQVIGPYLEEIRRVLKPGCKAVIHHANIDSPESHRQDDHPGWRSAMNVEIMRELAQSAGLKMVSEMTYWDAERGIGVPRFGDRISTFVAPH